MSSCEGAPVERVLVHTVPGHEGYTLSQPAMRQRDASRGCGPERSGDSGHDEEGDPGARKHVGLLAAAPENVRVPAFQPRHTQALACIAHQQLIDVLLRGMRAGVFADVRSEER